jgi:hypothetical protein
VHVEFAGVVPHHVEREAAVNVAHLLDHAPDRQEVPMIVVDVQKAVGVRAALECLGVGLPESSCVIDHFTPLAVIVESEAIGHWPRNTASAGETIT